MPDWLRDPLLFLLAALPIAWIMPPSKMNLRFFRLWSRFGAGPRWLKSVAAAAVLSSVAGAIALVVQVLSGSIESARSAGWWVVWFVY